MPLSRIFIMYRYISSIIYWCRFVTLSGTPKSIYLYLAQGLRVTCLYIASSGSTHFKDGIQRETYSQCIDWKCVKDVLLLKSIQILANGALIINFNKIKNIWKKSLFFISRRPSLQNGRNAVIMVKNVTLANGVLDLNYIITK